MQVVILKRGGWQGRGKTRAGSPGSRHPPPSCSAPIVGQGGHSVVGFLLLPLPPHPPPFFSAPIVGQGGGSGATTAASDGGTEERGTRPPLSTLHPPVAAAVAAPIVGQAGRAQLGGGAPPPHPTLHPPALPHSEPGRAQRGGGAATKAAADGDRGVGHKGVQWLCGRGVTSPWAAPTKGRVTHVYRDRRTSPGSITRTSKCVLHTRHMVNTMYSTNSHVARQSKRSCRRARLKGVCQEW
jgi:hypothetical protein